MSLYYLWIGLDHLDVLLWIKGMDHLWVSIRTLGVGELKQANVASIICIHWFIHGMHDMDDMNLSICIYMYGDRDIDIDIDIDIDVMMCVCII